MAKDKRVLSKEIVEQARALLMEHPEGMQRFELVEALGYRKGSSSVLTALEGKLPLYTEKHGNKTFIFLLRRELL